MEAKQRKEKFIALLNELLKDCNGLKIKLAKKLEINSSTLTRWFQGKIDPASLDLINFVRLSEIANLSSDELVHKLGMVDNSEQKALNKFQYLVKGLLSAQSMEELGHKLGVTYGAISGWVSSQKNINPERIPIATIVALAAEKGWTLERLLIYLCLKEAQTEDNLLFKVQSNTSILSLNDQIKLLAWLSDLVREKIIQKKIIVNQSDRTVAIVLEQEDIAIATNYASNLPVHLGIKPENITIAIIPTLPDSLEDIDVLIFDVSNADFPSLALIQDIDFDGDILVFSTIDLPEDVRKAISTKVTDVVVKPIDWQHLKEKEYFG